MIKECCNKHSSKVVDNNMAGKFHYLPIVTDDGGVYIERCEVVRKFREDRYAVNFNGSIIHVEELHTFTEAIAQGW